MSAAVVDIDHFKAINDRFSHAVGDAALREVGRIFQHTLRDGDFVGRFGGEEFVVLFRDAAVESAAAACERLRGALLRHPWSECLPALQSAVTASFGVAEAGESRTPEAWLARADAALYRAKRTGRNRVARDEVGDGAAPDAQGD